jgi:hypothetical protein
MRDQWGLIARSLQGLHALGERKEYLSPAEHEELLALVDFAHQRTIEKPEARLALDRLHTALPGVLPDA